MLKDKPTAAKTQVWNCPALIQNSSCMTLPQSQVNYKAEKLNSSLANRFWTRNPRLKHTSPAMMLLERQRSSLLKPETLKSQADPSGAETPTQVCYAKNLSLCVLFKIFYSEVVLNSTMISTLFCYSTISHLCFPKAFPTASIPFAVLLSQILLYHCYYIKNTLISYHLETLY